MSYEYIDYEEGISEQDILAKMTVWLEFFHTHVTNLVSGLGHVLVLTMPCLGLQ